MILDTEKAKIQKDIKSWLVGLPEILKNYPQTTHGTTYVGGSGISTVCIALITAFNEPEAHNLSALVQAIEQFGEVK